jgi:hypothetical protein
MSRGKRRAPRYQKPAGLSKGNRQLAAMQQLRANRVWQERTAPFSSGMIFAKYHKGRDRSKLVGGRARRQAGEEETTIWSMAQTAIEDG